MDEQQTTQQATVNDEAISPSEVQATQEVEQPQQPEGQQAGAITEVPEAGKAGTDEPEIMLDENGEVKFSDKFFGNVKDVRPEQSEQFEALKPETPKEAEPPEQQPYTEEELASIPYNQWDPKRISGDVKKYIPIVQRQIQRMRAAEDIQQRSNVPPIIQKPQELTPKELASAAQQIVAEKLGLKSAEEFDSYDPEHLAAYNMALSEVQGKYNAERAKYAQQVQEYQELNSFNYQLTQQAEFPEFLKWFDGKLRTKGITGAQINAGFMQHIQSGGRFSDIQGVITKWYQDYRQEKLQQKNVKPKAPKAPYLESSYGSGDATGKSVDVKSIEDMDTDGVAKFLMNNGYV